MARAPGLDFSFSGLKTAVMNHVRKHPDVSSADVTAEHAAFVARLPRHHNDPFDRLLLAQSCLESLRLVTVDRALETYGKTVQVVG